MTMSSIIYDKLCQLKLNYMNYHVYCHIRFGINFNVQFDILSIILFEINDINIFTGSYANLTNLHKKKKKNLLTMVKVLQDRRIE